MKLLETGEGKDLPKLKEGQHIFVDMWGNWAHYDSGCSTFSKRVEKFVENRKSSTSYFNQNYIKYYKSI